MAATPANAINVSTSGAVSFNGTAFTGGTLPIADGGTAAVSFNTNGVVISNTTSTGALAALSLTDGQLVIGRSAGAPLAATLTAGAGITISNGAGSITITAGGSGLTWNDATGSAVTLAVENGYVTDNSGGVTYTLPVTAVLGNEIQIVGKLGAWSIVQLANQQILLGSSSSTVGITGGVASTNVGDCIDMVCITGGASTIWRIKNSVGNITIT